MQTPRNTKRPMRWKESNGCSSSHALYRRGSIVELLSEKDDEDNSEENYTGVRYRNHRRGRGARMGPRSRRGRMIASQGQDNIFEAFQEEADEKPTKKKKQTNSSTCTNQSKQNTKNPKYSKPVPSKNVAPAQIKTTGAPTTAAVSIQLRYLVLSLLYPRIVCYYL